MAENKRSFILYCDQKGIWDKLSDEQAGKLIKHVLAYVGDENPTAPDFIIELAFESIKQQLKRDLRKWENQYNQRVEAGKRSADVRKHNSTVVNGRSISSTVNVNGNVTVNDNVNVIKDIGEKNGKFIIINSPYATETKYRIWGVSGLKQYLEMVGSRLPRDDYAEKFIREKDGQPFDDFGHVLKSYNLFIEKQYK